MEKISLLLIVAGVACCAKRLPHEAYAVGTYIGGGSWLFGPSDCTYEAPPAVAHLSTDEHGRRFMAKLEGEGSVIETCRDVKTTYDVVKATGGRINGPTSLKTGSDPSARFSFVPLAGTRELRGVHQGGPSPEWSLGKDCEGLATFGAVLGAQDTGGADITRTLVATRAGACTITATVIGITASKTVQIR